MLLSEPQIDVLTEIINIGTGRGASVLNSMTQYKVTLKVPEIRVLPYREIANEYRHLDADNHVSVNMPFRGKLTGEVHLLLTTNDARILLQIFNAPGSNEDLSESANRSTLEEIGNIILNAVMGSIANMLETHFQYAIPRLNEKKSKILFGNDDISENMAVILAQTNFFIAEKNISAEVFILLKLVDFDRLVEMIDRYMARLMGRKNEA